MRFEVHRTSQYDSDTAPCAGAFRGTYEYWDRRTCKTPEEYDARLGLDEPWHSKGTKHQKDGDGIKRAMGPRDCWYVELDSFDDLLAFAAEYGELVLGHALGSPDVPSIEIYDDYRE